MTFGSTLHRPWRLLFLMALLIACAGCDPEAIVRTKVPDPIKEFLTFSDSAGKAKRGGHGKTAQVELTVTSPANNSAHPAGRPITFRASALVEGQDLKTTDLTWALFEGQGKPLKPIGRGVTFNRPFDPGAYRVDVTISLPDNVKVTKSVNFRAFLSVSGKMIHNSRGLADVDLTLSDQKGGPVVSRAKSGPDGSFVIEIPAQGSFKLAPSKSEFSFSPPYQVVRHGEQPATPEFVGAKAQIQKVRLTATQESDDNLQSVCPEQEIRLKAEVRSEVPVTRVQAALVDPSAGVPKLLPVGEAVLSAESQGAGSSPEQRTLTITIPADVTGKAPKAVYGLRLTAHDTNGNSFSAEFPGSVSVDMGQCLTQRFAEAVAAHEQGDLDKAIRMYSKVEQAWKTIGAPASFAEYMEKNYFNRGLAHLETALTLPGEDVKRVGQFNKASADFKEVLKLHRKDAPAFLLSGLINHLDKNQEAALENYASAVLADPGLAEASALKGRIYLGTRLKKNLSRAVDEFTEALRLNPHDKGLRTTRSEVLKLDVKHQNDRDDAVVDISSVPLDELNKRLNVAKFRRK